MTITTSAGVTISVDLSPQIEVFKTDGIPAATIRRVKLGSGDPGIWLAREFTDKPVGLYGEYVPVTPGDRVGVLEPIQFYRAAAIDRTMWSVDHAIEPVEIGPGSECSMCNKVLRESEGWPGAWFCPSWHVFWCSVCGAAGYDTGSGICRFCHDPVFGSGLGKKGYIRAAELWGFLPANPEYRQISKRLADFYLLYAMSLEGREKKRFREFTRETAKEFAGYTDAACGGELRHIDGRYETDEFWEYSSYDTEAGLIEWTAEKPGISTDDRNAAWLGWYEVRKQHGAAALEMMRDAFSGSDSNSVGGARWARIAATLLDWERGRTNDVVFVDICAGLQHNGGVYFNKFYSCTDALRVLDLKRQAQTPYEIGKLRKYATNEIAALWTDHSAERMETNE